MTNAELESVDGGRERPYVVLEQTSLKNLMHAALHAAGISLSQKQVDQIQETMPDQQVYAEVVRKQGGRFPSRNASHALTQAGRQYDTGAPTLVAVSERGFRPRPVNVTLEPKVSIA